MWFKKFFLLGLLVFGLSINLHAEEEVAVSKAKVSSFVNDIGKPTTDALIENFEKLFGDVNNPSTVKFLEGEIQKEIVTIVNGTLITLGINTVQHKITEEFLMSTTKGVFKEVVGSTTIGSLATEGLKKGAVSVSKGMILGIFTDIVKDVMEKVVYQKTKSRVLAGSAVALVEQSVLLLLSGGNPHKILVAEATLLASRIWDISSALYEIDKIQNQTAHNAFNSDLSLIQIKYSKEYSKSIDNLPSQNLINRLNKEVDDRVEFYSDEIDLTEGATAFKSEIYSHLVAHKLSYRYIVLNRLKKNRDEVRYYNYLNNYFAPKERWFYKVRYSAIVSPYSDVDVKSRVHQDIYILGTRFNMKYISSQIVNSNNEKLKPNEYVGGTELVAWLDELVDKVEKTDGKSYDETKYLFIDDIDYHAYLTTISMSQIIHAFYKEIYGSNYVSCLSLKNRRKIVSFIIDKKLKELNYSRDDKSNIYLALKSYYDILPKSLNKLRILPATSLLSDKVYQRKALIGFGVHFLSNHEKNKKLMKSCKE